MARKTKRKDATPGNGRSRNGERLFDFRKMGAIMRKNLTVILRDKTRLLPLLMFPVFMIIIFGYTSGTAPTHIPAAVIAYDHSPLSQQLQDAIAHSQTFAVRRTVSTEGEGRKLLDAGTVRVLIVIPNGMQAAIDAGRQADVTVIVDESDSAIAITSRQALTALIDAFSAQLSQRRIVALQQSVGSAAATLRTAALAQQDGYAAIATSASSAKDSLVQAAALIAADRVAVVASAPLPTLFVPRTIPEGERFARAGDVSLIETTASASAGAQADLLDRALAFISQASAGVQQAASLASASSAASAARQGYQARQDLVEKPMRAISVFTAYVPHDLRAPLVYEEKPAYGTGKREVDFLIPAIIALTIFQGAVMGMGRAVAGEKREGSLTRVFLTPTSNATIILGTLLFYVIFELFRSAFLILFAVTLFHVQIEGSLLAIVLILVIYAGVSTGVGMILSSMVSTEQQYQGLALLVGMPTVFLAGVFFPLEAMPRAFQILAAFLPVTYAAEALRDVMIKGFGLALIIPPLLILLVFLAGTLGLLFVAFKRDIE